MLFAGLKVVDVTGLDEAEQDAIMERVAELELLAYDTDSTGDRVVAYAGDHIAGAPRYYNEPMTAGLRKWVKDEREGKHRTAPESIQEWKEEAGVAEYADSDDRVDYHMGDKN